MTGATETVAERFAEVGLAPGRFVTVKDGQKMCVDHDTRFDDPRDVPGQNYGLYSDHDDQLVILDVDDHRGGDGDISTVAVAALGALPLTLKIQSPHVDEEGHGGHRVFKLTGDETPAELFKRRFGKANPIPSWGEIIAKNKYVVGPGSQLDDCDKDWCDRCAESDGGWYEIAEGREIAEVDPETLIDALAADPDLNDAEAADDETQTLAEVDGDSGGSPHGENAHKNTQTADGAESYDDLDRGTVKEMLEAIPGDQHFDDWIRAGYAVHDWNDGEAGKEVFEQWSRGNKKWEEEESQRQIDYIWNNNKRRSEEHKATVGTLIHLAQERGWTPPNAGGQAGTTDRPAQDIDVAAQAPSDWGQVRAVYEAAENTEEVTKGSARKAAADKLEAEKSWMYVLESERLWVYDEKSGTYDGFGEAKAGQLLKENLSVHYSQTERREIIGHLRDGNQTHREELNARTRDAPLLCVGDGVIDLETGEKMDHSPEFRFVRGLPWDYDPDSADPGPILDFLDDVTERAADRDTLLDHLAHGLMPGHPYRAFVVCYGPGGNGKTQVAELFRGFVGEENAAAVEIDELTDDDFATGDLPGTFINWGDDMAGDGGGTLEELSLLKKATGGSKIRANEKFEKTFDFTNEAAMFFSANEPPRIGERKRSMQDRIYPIEMPYEFESDPDPDDPMKKQKVPNISSQLLDNDEAMRGLLGLAIEHAQDLIDSRGEYSQPEDPEERLEKYNQSADPIVRFAGRAVEPASGDLMIRKDDVFRVYRAFVESWGERSSSERGFKRQFPKAFTEEIEDGQSRSLATVDDERERVVCWKRITWTETAKREMPDWMIERYSDHYSEEIDGSEPDTVEAESSNEQVPLATLEPQYGAELIATVKAVSEGEYSREEQGRLCGPHGTYVGFVIPGGSDTTLELFEGETVRLSSVTLRTDDDGLLEAVVDDATEVERVEKAGGPGDSGDSTAAADGGTATADGDGLAPLSEAKRQTLEYLRDEPRGRKRGEILSEVCGSTGDSVTPDVAEEAVQGLKEDGRVTEGPNGRYTVGK